MAQGLSEEARKWWSKQRWRYNRGLVIAGVSAFVCYVIVLSVFQSDERLAEAEITVFTTLVQGIGYLFMMGIANLCYNLGPWTESLCSPTHPERFRKGLFQLGFWFSVAMPFLIPVLLLLILMTVPVLD